MMYQVEQSLKHVCGMLQRLESKSLSKLDAVVTWMYNTALHLEKSEAGLRSTTVMVPASSTTNHAEMSLPQLIFVVNETSSPDQSSAAEFATQNVHRPRQMRLGFVIGVMAAAMTSTGTPLGIGPMWADRLELVQPLPRGLILK